MSRSVRTLAATALVALATTGMAACGIPSDDHPRAIPEQGLPTQAVEPRGTGSTSTTAAPNATQVQTLYLVGGSDQQQRLIPVSVAVPVPADPGLLPRATIEKLIATRPEDVDKTGQATNQLPSDVQVLSAEVQPDGVLDLDLSDLGVENARLRLALAQIVFTATDLKLNGITGVRVSIGGVPAQVPTQSGSVEPGTVLTKADYPDLDPQVQPQPS